MQMTGCQANISLPLSDGDHNLIFMEHQYRVVVVRVANILLILAIVSLYRIVPVLFTPVSAISSNFPTPVCSTLYLFFLEKKIFLIILSRSGQQSN